MEKNSLSRIEALDGLRAIAAIGIAFLLHFKHFTGDGESFIKAIPWINSYGFLLVDLFFVLSGFIFAYVYQQVIEAKKLTFGKFIFWRFSRLYPLHLLTLLVVALSQIIYTQLYGASFVYKDNTGFNFLLNLLFIQFGWITYQYSFNAPAWSISLELFAYIVFFIISYFFGKNKRYVIYAGLILFGFTLQYHKQILVFNQYIGEILIGFFMGCVVFELNKILRGIFSKNFITISLLGFLFLTFLLPLGNWMLMYPLLVFPLIVLLSLNNDFIYKALSVKPLEYLGKISFSIYLWHFPIQILILILIQKMNISPVFNSIQFFIFYVLTVLVVSVLSYHFFELPVQNLLRSAWTRISKR